MPAMLSPICIKPGHFLGPVLEAPGNIMGLLLIGLHLTANSRSVQAAYA